MTSTPGVRLYATLLASALCVVTLNANTFQYDGRAYYYIADLQTWADAELNCVSQYNGHLVSFYSATQMAAVYSGLGSPSDFWIGFNDIATEGTWVWTDESPVSFTAWISGQPSNSGGNEDCAHFHIGNEWNDNSCYRQMASVCFAYLPTASPTSSAPTTTPEVTHSFPSKPCCSVLVQDNIADCVLEAMGIMRDEMNRMW
eukprot:CAMPEP_0114254508 /NCGR_PEP_ID=MMETSP0058-20121206/17017_1 /TAXON_ID=36894 /ORGANISM="Pyramimonas parkeae, CCMP726" /LENGTH=200 /DNA_ID=CAMNT_0001368733 /DNA_START=65 /DNA_END=664 /DNA_ORIENTATION=-